MIPTCFCLFLSLIFVIFGYYSYDRVYCIIENSEIDSINGYYLSKGGFYFQIGEHLTFLPDFFQYFDSKVNYGKSIIIFSNSIWSIVQNNHIIYYNNPSTLSIDQPPPGGWVAEKNFPVNIKITCNGSLQDSPPQNQENSNLQIIFNRPVTTSLLLIFLTIYYLVWIGKLNVDHLVFSYDSVIHRGEYYRIVSASLSHVDLMHLGFNSLTLYQLGILEPTLGSLNFFSFNLLLIFLTISICLGLYGLLIYRFGRQDLLVQPALGFSCVLFAWMVVASVKMNTYCPIFFLPNLCFKTTRILGTLPMNIGPFVLLLITKLILPRSSFLGHLSGILIGYPLSWGWLNALVTSSPTFFFSFVFLGLFVFDERLKLTPLWVVRNLWRGRINEEGWGWGWGWGQRGRGFGCDFWTRRSEGQNGGIGEGEGASGEETEGRVILDEFVPSLSLSRYRLLLSLSSLFSFLSLILFIGFFSPYLSFPFRPLLCLLLFLTQLTKRHSWTAPDSLSPVSVSPESLLLFSCTFIFLILSLTIDISSLGCLMFSSPFLISSLSLPVSSPSPSPSLTSTFQKLIFEISFLHVSHLPPSVFYRVGVSLFAVYVCLEGIILILLFLSLLESRPYPNATSSLTSLLPLFGLLKIDHTSLNISPSSLSSPPPSTSSLPSISNDVCLNSIFSSSRMISAFILVVCRGSGGGGGGVHSDTHSLQGTTSGWGIGGRGGVGRRGWGGGRIGGSDNSSRSGGGGGGGGGGVGGSVGGGAGRGVRSESTNLQHLRDLELGKGEGRGRDGGKRGVINDWESDRYLKVDALSKVEGEGKGKEEAEGEGNTIQSQIKEKGNGHGHTQEKMGGRERGIIKKDEKKEAEEEEGEEEDQSSLSSSHGLLQPKRSTSPPSLSTTPPPFLPTPSHSTSKNIIKEISFQI